MLAAYHAGYRGRTAAVISHCAVRLLLPPVGVRCQHSKQTPAPVCTAALVFRCLLLLTENEKLQAEIAALRAELQSLQDIRSDLRNVASMTASFSSMTGAHAQQSVRPCAQIRWWGFVEHTGI